MYSVNLIAMLDIIGDVLALDILDYKYSSSKPFAVLTNSYIFWSHKFLQIQLTVYMNSVVTVLVQYLIIIALDIIYMNI